MRIVFDRGSIVLHDPPPGLDRIELPGLLWDDRVGAWRAPAHLYGALHRALTGSGVRVFDEVAASWPPPSGFTAIDLRPYQESALDAWRLGQRRGILVLPTGAGKTRVALAAMASPPTRSLVLVPTRALLDQWCREVARFYRGPVGRYGDGVHDLRAVTVATFESAYRHPHRLGDRFDLLIVDEAHHAGGREEMLETSVARARLGLTATPPRDEAACRQLAQLIGPIRFEVGLAELSGSYLAPFDRVTLRLELDPEERRAYVEAMTCFRSVHDRYRAAHPGGSWAGFVRLAGELAEGRRALEGWRRARLLVAYTRAKKAAVGRLLERHRDGKTLVFTADNATAYAIARDHLLMPLTCDIGRRERTEALRRLGEGTLRALVSARVLNEGIDVPDADVAIITGGAGGEREHAQRIGRLLRPRDGKCATVYELVAQGTHEVGQAHRRGEGFASRAVASP